jgi:hypothetical protein
MYHVGIHLDTFVLEGMVTSDVLKEMQLFGKEAADLHGSCTTARDS